MPVDLENLAAGYDHRPPSPDGLARAKRAADAVGLTPGDVAMDIGGGRGHHSAVWGNLGALAIVVDPAKGMVRSSAEQFGVVPVRGVAQQLPFRDDSARLVYFHLSIHYGDWRASLDEAVRVLAAGGECWVWTMGEEHHRQSFLARWFPSVGDIDSARFPDPQEVVEHLTKRGAAVESGIEVEPKRMAAAAWRAGVTARFVSTLQLLSDTELSDGLAAFDQVHPDPDEPVDYVLTFDWIRARL
jgi:ubiquinone/menaquinone biosynthesis C-methylase UbiE